MPGSPRCSGRRSCTMDRSSPRQRRRLSNPPLRIPHLALAIEVRGEEGSAERRNCRLPRHLAKRDGERVQRVVRALTSALSRSLETLDYAFNPPLDLSAVPTAPRGCAEGLVRLRIDHYAVKDLYASLPGLRAMSHMWNNRPVATLAPRSAI